MKITFLALSAACAAISLAEAVPAPRPHEDGPKYYYPRVVKRQTETNNTSPEGTPVGSATSIDESDSSTQSNNGGLGDTLATIISSITDGLGNAAPTSTGGTTVGIDTVISDTGSPANTAPTPTTTPDDTKPPTTTADDSAPVTTSQQGLGDALSSAVDQLTSSLASVFEPSDTATPPSPTPSPTTPTDDTAQQPTTQPQPTSSGGLIDSLTSALNPPVPTPTTTQGDDVGTTDPPPPPPTTTGGFETTTPDPPTSLPTTGPTNPPPPPTSTPDTNDQPTSTPSVTDKPTDQPTDQPTTQPQPTTDAPPPPAANVTTPEPPTVTPTDLPTTLPPSSKEPPQSILPTGTDNATAVVPPSLIETAAPPTSTTETKTVPTTQATTLPSDVPRVITPEGGIPVAPENSTLIQIGFKEGLHYEFVVGSQLAVSQIFTFSPIGIADGLGIAENKVVMQYLQPYNTLAKLHYVTTLAMGYVPSDEIDKLSMEILNANSALYDNPNKSVKTLMNMIDPSIPLLAGQGLTPGGTPVDTNNNDQNANSNEGDAPGGDGGGSGVKPSSVGIAVGAVAGAAVYGAAMFLVARRYKKRKAAHQRASSVQTDETPRAGEGTNLMAGARNSYGSRAPGRMNSNNGGRGSRNSDRSDESGRSGRTYISPPVMAENSLGWN
ncbi:uncharacterized protein AB675_6129 [Cyphellophora attinorum]|uniref:Signaling mucin MSB2 n=1 Tax=Cyphellophora attinorum TaxID=1664694 RepID=A0A0N1HF43_9EURO|nr:uncharacterized protein AB675_6129 [Phialophora attinorum]KPI43824.1 hypothetical protein AB675_6129 [Phialophora attinorum]